PALAQWSVAYRAGRIDPVMRIREATHYAGDEDVRWAFQRVDKDFLRLACDALLGNEMGTGKTRVLTEGMALIRRQYQEEMQHGIRAVIFCPNAVKSQWRDHILEHAPEFLPFIVEGGKKKREKLIEEASEHPNSVVIVNHEAARLVSRLAPYGNIALNEDER